MHPKIYAQCTMSAEPLPTTEEVWEDIVKGGYLPISRLKVRDGETWPPYEYDARAQGHKYIVAWRNIAPPASTSVFHTVEDNDDRPLVDPSVFKNSLPGRINRAGEFVVDGEAEAAELAEAEAAKEEARNLYPYAFE